MLSGSYCPSVPSVFRPSSAQCRCMFASPRAEFKKSRAPATPFTCDTTKITARRSLGSIRSHGVSITALDASGPICIRAATAGRRCSTTCGVFIQVFMFCGHRSILMFLTRNGIAALVFSRPKASAKPIFSWYPSTWLGGWRVHESRSGTLLCPEITIRAIAVCCVWLLARRRANAVSLRSSAKAIPQHTTKLRITEIRRFIVTSPSASV